MRFQPAFPTKCLFFAILVSTQTTWSFAQNKIIFVTSESTDGSISEPGFSDGILAADAICNRLATAAGLDMTNGSYKAWLSTSTSSPNTTFSQATIPYVLPNGTQVANNYADLLDDSILATIDRDENSTDLSSSPQSVWTGTLMDGTADINHCTDWTVDASGSGMRGATNRLDGEWTELGSSGCSVSNRRLYCVQQGPVPVDLMAFSVE